MKAKHFFLSEKGPLPREPHGGWGEGAGAKTLELTVSRNQTQGPRHRLGLHVPSWWSLHSRAGHRPGRGQLSSAAPGPLFPQEQAQDPDGRVHWKHLLRSSLHLSSLYRTCLCFALPSSPSTPPAQQYLNLRAQPPHPAPSPFRPLSP